MRMLPSVPRRLLCAGVCAGALAVTSGGCSYLQGRHAKAEPRADPAKSPGNLMLEKDYAPQDGFGLIGRVAIPREQKPPLLVAAFDHAKPGGQPVIPSDASAGRALDETTRVP